MSGANSILDVAWPDHRALDHRRSRGALSNAARHDSRSRHAGNAGRSSVFFACEQDLSHDPVDNPLPEAVAKGIEPFLIIGSIAGG
jgi:hypothetical protein